LNHHRIEAQKREDENNIKDEIVTVKKSEERVEFDGIH